MKYVPIKSELFLKNRKKFMAEMKPNSLAVFNSNDVYPVSADSTLPFEQHRDILYLSGVDQEESVLILFPDCPKESLREILFTKNVHRLTNRKNRSPITPPKIAEPQQDYNFSHTRRVNPLFQPR